MGSNIKLDGVHFDNLILYGDHMDIKNCKIKKSISHGEEIEFENCNEDRDDTVIPLVKPLHIKKNTETTVYDFSVVNYFGENISMSKFKGKPLLIMNFDLKSIFIY